MLTKKFYLQHTIDVYVSELDESRVKITFHRMTTREKLEINTTRYFAEFLALLNGQRSVLQILNQLGNYNIDDAKSMIFFLENNHLITEKSHDHNDNLRYARQVAYFDDVVFSREGQDSQNILKSKKIVIFGIGAVTSIIAETLVRAGVENILIIDYKLVSKSNISRHLFARYSDIGKLKINVLENYLKSINANLKIKTIIHKLIPSTNLEKLIPENTSLVINGCDEPYIGHTSMKLGLYLQNKNIPLYVMGGFDAHLMSSGELVYPPKTPCISCIQKTFSNALEDWQPTYITTNSFQQMDMSALDINIDKKQHDIKFTNNIGGAGGMIMMSAYSANISSLKIIHFLIDDPHYDYQIMRYEYLPNTGKMTGFGLLKQEGCDVCNG